MIFWVIFIPIVTGKHLAIREFNAAHPREKPIYGLKHFPKLYDQQQWLEMILSRLFL
jgi:hypothetical protein